MDPATTASWAATGSDKLLGLDDNDHVDGGPGDDFLLSGGPGNDTIIDGDGNDIFVKGDEGDDVIFLGPGSDKVFSEQGNDTIYLYDDGVSRRDLLRRLRRHRHSRRRA